MKTIQRHIEFWSGIACIAFLIAAPFLFHVLGVPDAANLVVSLGLVGIVQLVMLHFIYQRRQTAQRKTIDQVREMLRDRILNRLAIIWLQVQRTQPTDHQLRRIQETLSAIEAEISQLSGDTLEAWLKTYDNVSDLEDTQMLRRMGSS
jgi:hypothetical protein